MTVSIKEMTMDNLLQDLAEFLAYHASVNYRECRDIMGADNMQVPQVIASGRTDCDVEFTVTHLGREFTVVIEENV